jgi:hypothetical protein
MCTDTIEESFQTIAVRVSSGISASCRSRKKGTKSQTTQCAEKFRKQKWNKRKEFEIIAAPRGLMMKDAFIGLFISS